MKLITRNLTLAVGLSVCGISGYLLYLFLKKDEEDDYLSTLKGTKFAKREIRIPKEIVRFLIGRTGKQLKTIEEESRTKITFRDYDRAEEQVCIITGRKQDCDKAEVLIQKFIRDSPCIGFEDMSVPTEVISKLTRRNSEALFEITCRSGAKIVILDEIDTTAQTRKLCIKGSKQQIVVAKSLIEDLATKYEEYTAQLESSVAKREPRLPPKVPSSPKPQADAPKVESMLPVPGQSDGQFEVYVSAMVDPSRFWVQVVGPKATELDQLVEEMTDYYGRKENRELHTLNRIEKGDLVAAIFQYDGKWYRAEVLSKEPDETTAELYYVDYGDTDKVPCEELYELRTDFLKLHFQAIECYLARVEPAEEKWSVEAIDKFEEWTHVARWHKLSAKINGYCIREKTRAKREGSPVPGVDLFDVTIDQDIDIAQELVHQGYAVFKKDADLRSSRATSTSNISVASNS